jgi:hypothetical protein
MLKPVVQHGDGGSISGGATRDRMPVRVSEDRCVRLQPAVEEKLVGVSSGQDGRVVPRREKPARDLGSERRLPAPAHGQPPDRDHGNRSRPALENSRIVQGVSNGATCDESHGGGLQIERGDGSHPGSTDPAFDPAAEPLHGSLAPRAIRDGSVG